MVSAVEAEAAVEAAEAVADLRKRNKARTCLCNNKKYTGNKPSLRSNQICEDNSLEVLRKDLAVGEGKEAPAAVAQAAAVA
jgi:hypothetical protein